VAAAAQDGRVGGRQRSRSRAALFVVIAGAVFVVDVVTKAVEVAGQIELGSLPAEPVEDSTLPKVGRFEP
jgi:hypothetical protein